MDETIYQYVSLALLILCLIIVSFNTGEKILNKAEDYSLAEFILIQCLNESKTSASFTTGNIELNKINNNECVLRWTTK
jgi:hypothetical protein